MLAIVISIGEFLIKHWKLVLLVSALGGMGVTGFHLAKSWDRERALVAQADTLKHRLGTIALINSSDAKRAQADQATIEHLKEAVSETPPDSRAGLDRAAVGRLRSIR